METKTSVIQIDSYGVHANFVELNSKHSRLKEHIRSGRSMLMIISES